MSVIFVMVVAAVILATGWAMFSKSPIPALVLAILTCIPAVLFANGFWRESREIERLKKPTGIFQADLSTPGDYEFVWATRGDNPFCHGTVICIEPDPPVERLRSLDGARELLKGLKFRILMRGDMGQVVFQKAYAVEDFLPMQFGPTNLGTPGFRTTWDLPAGKYEVHFVVAEGAPGLANLRYDLVARQQVDLLPVARMFMGVLAAFFGGIFMLNAGRAAFLFRRRRLARVAGPAAV